MGFGCSSPWCNACIWFSKHFRHAQACTRSYQVGHQCHTFACICVGGHLVSFTFLFLLWFGVALSAGLQVANKKQTTNNKQQITNNKCLAPCRTSAKCRWMDGCARCFCDPSGRSMSVTLGERQRDAEAHQFDVRRFAPLKLDRKWSRTNVQAY